MRRCELAARAAILSFCMTKDTPLVSWQSYSSSVKTLFYELLLDLELVTHNYRFPTLAELRDAVHAALEQLPSQSILSIIGGEPLVAAEAT